MTLAYILDRIVVSCRDILTRSYEHGFTYTSGTLLERVTAREEISPRSCLGRYVLGHPVALCPCCATFLAVMRREPPALVERCVRCGALYDASGSCTNRQSGCQGGRGEHPGKSRRTCFDMGLLDPHAPHGRYCGLPEGHDGPHAYTIDR